MVFNKNNIKNHKLTLSFLLIIALFCAFGVVTIKGLFTLGNLTRSIYEHPLVVSNASLIAAVNITKMHRSMKDVVLATSPDELDHTLVIVAENEQQVYRYLDMVRDKILGEQGQALERQTRQLFESWKPIREDVVRLLKSGKNEDAILITKTVGAEHVSKLERKMLDLTSYARKKADRFLTAAEASQSRLEKITVVMTLTGVLLSLLIAILATYRVLKAEKVLLDKNDKLEKALGEIKILRGIIPICSHCKQLRDDEGIWKRIEEYFRSHSEASFSHGICPSCLEEHYPEAYVQIKSGKTNP